MHFNNNQERVAFLYSFAHYYELFSVGGFIQVFVYQLIACNRFSLHSTPQIKTGATCLTLGFHSPVSGTRCSQRGELRMCAANYLQPAMVRRHYGHPERNSSVTRISLECQGEVHC